MIRDARLTICLSYRQKKSCEADHRNRQRTVRQRATACENHEFQEIDIDNARVGTSWRKRKLNLKLRQPITVFPETLFYLDQSDRPEILINNELCGST
jgi:hypothetical protein